MLWTAFGISALLHLLVLLVYPGLTDRQTGLIRSPAPTVAPSDLDGMEVVRILEQESDDEELDPEAPAEPVDPTRPAPVRLGPATESGGPEVDPGPAGPSAAERLRVRLDDRRLWAPVDPAYTQLSTEQRLELELAGRLEEWNDSVRAAEEARRAATDWTYTDSEGGRWGVADGKIYLGDIALPLPVSFGGNAWQMEQARYAEWEWLELQRGAVTGEIRDSWKERAQAIRERRDQERARARPDTSGVR